MDKTLRLRIRHALRLNCLTGRNTYGSGAISLVRLGSLHVSYEPLLSLSLYEQKSMEAGTAVHNSLRVV